MKDQELDIFLTNDYIYIPYENKDKLNLRSDNLVYKNDEIGDYLGRKEYSPVSGKAYGLSSIYSFSGPKNVLIVENDFIDKTSSKLISVKDIYELDKSIVIDKTRDIVGEESILTLVVSSISNFDIKDEFLLRDNVKEILETLNIIDSVYDDLSVKIRLNKQDTKSYQLLFSYLGTYPNIDIVFNENSNEKEISIYDIIDIYDSLKNRNRRDYVYVTVVYNSSLSVIKTKRNSNLKDLLEYLNVMSTKIIINDKLKTQNGNFLIDESVSVVNVM